MFARTFAPTPDPTIVTVGGSVYPNPVFVILRDWIEYVVDPAPIVLMATAVAFALELPFGEVEMDTSGA